jgi:hypothetical protein
MTERTDVVIPVHNAGDFFWNCIQTLRQWTENYRLILVDDYSDAETEEKVRTIARQHQNSILIRTAKQRWFTRAVNLGLRMARTPRVVILNSDCVVDIGWLEELQGVWEEVEGQGAKVGLVGSTMSEEELRRWEVTTGADYVTAHCIMCSMHALTEVSVKRGTPGIYLDETKQPNIHIRSDVGLSWDLNALGYTTVRSFKSKVGHHGGKSWAYNLAAINSVSLQDVND